jgi:tetratricopeptide (TPR) repeat protein
MSLSAETITERYTTSLNALSDIAEAYYFQGGLDDAFRLWQSAEPLLAFREIQPADRMKFWLHYGDFLVFNYFLTSREKELMESIVQRARQEAEALQDEAGIATALALTGKAQYFDNLKVGRSDYAEARNFFQRTSALREKIGDAYNLADSLFYTGLTYIWEGQEEQARAYFQRALELAEQHGNKWAASEATRHLADVSMVKDKDYEQSLRYALRSLALREEIGFKRTYPAAHLLVSDVYVQLGDLERALAHCQQAEVLAEEMKLQTYLVGTRLTRGDVAYKRGQFVEAREHFEKGAELARQLNDAHWIAEANEKLAMLADEQKN